MPIVCGVDSLQGMGRVGCSLDKGAQGKVQCAIFEIQKFLVNGKVVAILHEPAINLNGCLFLWKCL